MRVATRQTMVRVPPSFPTTPSINQFTSDTRAQSLTEDSMWSLVAHPSVMYSGTADLQMLQMLTTRGNSCRQSSHYIIIIIIIIIIINHQKQFVVRRLQIK